MIYREIKKDEFSRSTLNFSSLEELCVKAEALKNSNVKTVHIIKDEIEGVNPIVVRNTLLEILSGTEAEITMYI